MGGGANAGALGPATQLLETPWQSGLGRLGPAVVKGQTERKLTVYLKDLTDSLFRWSNWHIGLEQHHTHLWLRFLESRGTERILII